MSTESSVHPKLETSWSADALDTGAIHDELNRLWAELGGPPKGGDAPGEMIAESHFGGGGLMRANTLNLLAVAASIDHAEAMTQTIARLRDFLPSRTIMLVPEERGIDVEGAGTFDVHLALRDQDAGDAANEVRFETITIRASSEDVGQLASLVTPLLVAELPDFLWWPGGDFARDPLFDDLSRIVDRVIVDTAQLGRDISGVGAMRDLIDPSEDATGPVIGDFTWLRLDPWRQLIAQFFDPQDVQRSLRTIEDVRISYAELRSDGSSGFASALLIVGWLASRLDWEITDPLERRKDGGWSAPLRATIDGKGKDISLRLTPDRSPYARFSLRSVEINAFGDAPGKFVIERTDTDDLVTSSETPTVPAVSRMVYAKRPTNDVMLGEQLQRFGHERVFEDALTFATRLLP